MTNPSGPTAQRHNARCVIWRPRDTEVPPELRTALQQRGLWFTECDTASWATAEVCHLNQVDSATPVILLLMSPKDLDNAEAVLTVCDRYAPHATHWVYDENCDPKLHAVFRTGPKNDQPEPAPNASLVGTEIDPTTDIPYSGCKTGQESPSILSGDELDALKHPDQGAKPRHDGTV
jgi:hypothetical protein